VFEWRKKILKSKRLSNTIERYFGKDKNMNMFKVTVFTVLSMLIIVWGFAWPFRISGDCMEPAIKDGQLCYLNRILPHLRQFQINDIILFNHEDKVWISRIVALENNTIHITDGSIIVDGKPLQAAGIQRNWLNWKQGSYSIDKPLHIPINHVYVLSDNLPAQHDDSRVFGPVAKEAIIGSVW
jgi:signal peptidase I